MHLKAHLFGVLTVACLQLGAHGGCGAPDETFSAPDEPSSIVQPLEARPAAEVNQDPSALQSVTSEEVDPANLKAACCYFMCSDNTHLWWGPNRDVVYNNCTNTGAAWCPNHHHGRLYKAKWDNC